MATTNAQIISQYKQAHGLPIDYPLNTWATWKAMGYMVKRGEKCKHRVTMWKHATKTVEQDGQERTVGKCFYKTMNLFEAGQVERMI